MSVANYQNHKLIVPAVGLEAMVGDIQKTLGINSGDLGTVCESRFINRWARYKPVVRSGLVKTSDQQAADGTWKPDADWWRGTVSNNPVYLNRPNSGYIENKAAGLTMRLYFGDLLTYLIPEWDTYGWQRFWQYTPPTGGASAPYRILDFSYYLHRSELSGGEDNDKPISNFLCPTSIERFGEDTNNDGYSDTYTLMYSPVPSIYKRANNPYLLSTSDLNVKNGAAQNLSLDDYYFGLIAVSGSVIRVATAKYKLGSGSYDDDGDYYSVRLQDWFTFQMTSGRFYPILSADRYLSDSDQPSGNSAGMFGSFDAPIIPLPYDPVEFTQTAAAVTLKITVTLVSRTAGTATIDVTVKNVSQANYNTSWSTIPYSFVVIEKDASGATLYNDEEYTHSVTSTVGTDGLTLSPGASATKRLALSTAYSSYGYFATFRAGIGGGSYIGDATLTIDYNP